MKYTSIADAGQSIIELLRDNLVPEPVKKKERIALCSPAEKGDMELTMYLYNIETDAETMLQGMYTLPDGKMRKNPVSLSLYYLLTAYSNSQLISKAYDEHKILGRAIQVLRDNPVLEGNTLKGNLKGSGQKINIYSKNLTYDEIMRIWNFKDVPYSLSMAYKVSPVYIESAKIRSVQRVVDANFDVGYERGEDDA